MIPADRRTDRTLEGRDAANGHLSGVWQKRLNITRVFNIEVMFYIFSVRILCFELLFTDAGLVEVKGKVIGQTFI
jgi:hypothetical protein